MKEMAVWKVRVDTGGTFTDAWCRTPDGEERRCKVLSDGRMRVRLGPDEGVWWKLLDELPDGFLVGWKSSVGGFVAEHCEGRLRVEGGKGAEVLELDGGEEAPDVTPS